MYGKVGFKIDGNIVQIFPANPLNDMVERLLIIPFHTQMGTMVLEDFPTKLVPSWGKCIGKYSSTMVCIWDTRW